MSDVQILRGALEKAASRRRWQRAWTELWRGLLIGSLLLLVALVSFKLFPIPFEVVTIAGIVGSLCLVGGFIYGWSRKMSLAETARWLDEKQHLQERLSTALEVSEKPIEQNWQQLITSDAAQHVQGFDARKLLPFHLSRATHWALLVLVLAVGLGFVPEYRSKEFVQRQNEKEVIKEVGKKLADLTRRDLQSRPPALEPTRQSLESIEQLGNVLGKNPVTKNEALKGLASVADKLKSDLKEMGKNPALKPLERAARTPSKTGSAMTSDMQKQMDNLQKALGDKMASPDALDQMKDKLEAMKQSASGLPDKDSPEGKAARQQMAQQLADMAKQMKDMGQPLDSLEEAIAALQNNKPDLFLKDLDLATNDLEKLKDMAKQLKQMQQQAGQKPGKDLAEQLKNGQAEAAQGTLKKMMDQLKSQNLSKEELKKLLDEVSKAVDPASPYGKVAEHLKDAAAQLQKGEKPGASESLSKAADELKNLMDQMGDAESLMAALEACKKAQMCIGNCQGWKQCNGPPKSGKGGKGGKGVGTWADESGWLYYPEISERWDNTGLQRPDMDPKGQTDRGDGQLADNLKGEKLRGQFSPGPMPSITLKGVSIKGTSTVGYQEAAAAAQSDAQAAINQDQVPRAYRGAVKDYFDDLKK
jgi:hypothetical protein